MLKSGSAVSAEPGLATSVAAPMREGPDPAETADAGPEEEVAEQPPVKVPGAPQVPSAKEREEHEASGHVDHRSW